MSVLFIVDVVCEEPSRSLGAHRSGSEPIRDADASGTLPVTFSEATQSSWRWLALRGVRNVYVQPTGDPWARNRQV